MERERREWEAAMLRERRRQEDAWVRDQEPPARQARDTLVRGSFGFSSPLEGGKWGSE